MDSSLSHRGGLNAFYWYQIFALDSAVVEVQEIPFHLHTYMDIDYEIFSKRVVVSYKRKDEHDVLVSLLVKLSQGKNG